MEFKLSAALQRPLPSADLVRALEHEMSVFVPAPEVEAWALAAFITPGSALYPAPETVNSDHVHLLEAKIGFLWATEENRSGGKRKGGTAEMPTTQGDTWKRGRFFQQLREWFGEEPDFLITLDVEIALSANDISFCALVEHELYHCGHKTCPDGGFKYTKDGRPQFYLRPHDVEEFTPIAKRYGVKACAGDSAAFVEAANQQPLFGYADLNCICGTCGR